MGKKNKLKSAGKNLPQGLSSSKNTGSNAWDNNPSTSRAVSDLMVCDSADNCFLQDDLKVLQQFWAKWDMDAAVVDMIFEESGGSLEQTQRQLCEMNSVPYQDPTGADEQGASRFVSAHSCLRCRPTNSCLCFRRG